MTDPALLVDAALVLVALVGLADGVYFTLVTYGRLAPDARFIPRICRMGDAACGTIIRHPSARALGLPNSVYGLAWYAAVLVAPAALRTVPEARDPVCIAYVAAAGFTIVFSAYLFWVLRARLRTHCPLCYVGHAANLLIGALLVARCAP